MHILVLTHTLNQSLGWKVSVYQKTNKSEFTKGYKFINNDFAILRQGGNVLVFSI